jgi:hypothetical protein
MPDCFGEPVVTNSCAFYFAHEAAGEPDHPAFPAPSIWDGLGFVHGSGAIRVARSVDLWLSSGEHTLTICALAPELPRPRRCRQIVASACYRGS